MAESKPITADEYVTAKLIETEENLTQACHHIKTLEDDLNAFHADMESIHKVFKIELTSTGEEYKIVCYANPLNKWNTNILALSGSLKEEEFRDEFKHLMKVLHLELPGEEDYYLEDSDEAI